MHVIELPKQRDKNPMKQQHVCFLYYIPVTRVVTTIETPLGTSRSGFIAADKYLPVVEIFITESARAK